MFYIIQLAIVAMADIGTLLPPLMNASSLTALAVVGAAGAIVIRGTVDRRGLKL